MKVSVSDQSPTQKRLQVEIPANTVKKELDKRYRELAKKVKLKGFRPGKAPRSILKSYYGKSVETEVSNQFVQESYSDALKQAEIKPLAEADVDTTEFNDDGTFTYETTVEVCPPFEIEGYKGLEIVTESTEVSEDEVVAELEQLRERHAELESLDEDHPVEEGHSAVIDFVPTVDGEIYEKGKSTDYMMEVGKKALHPDFDSHLIGRKAGETVEFDLDYPEDTPSQDLAGKTVHFQVVIKEVKQKILPELNDDFAKDLGELDTLEQLKEKVKDDLSKAKEQSEKARVREEIISSVIEATDFELSEKALEREVERMVAQLKQQFQSQGLQIDTSAFDTPEIRAEYRPQAEKNLRWMLISEKIAEIEDLQLAEEEEEELYEQAARLFRVSVDTVKTEYADSGLLEQMKASKIQDKVLDLLEANLSPKEASDSAAAGDTEQSETESTDAEPSDTEQSEE